MSCENCEESAYVIDKLAKLLAEIAVIVNGPELPLTSWSYHDLPEKVRALKQAPPAQPVAWMSHSALTGQPVFDINPPDESSLAGAIPLFAAPQAPPVEWFVQWIRNNYQNHPNIASLCDAMREAANKENNNERQ